MIINPFSIINDGLLDISWIEQEAIMGLCGVAATMDKAKKGGIHAYDGNFRFRRGKTVKVSFKGIKAKKQPVNGTE
jgi:hypothetical protein